MKSIKEAYLKTKENAWSYASHKSEASRLAAIPEELLADPQALYEHFTRAGYKPYTIKTLFVRASQLHEFAYPNKPNKVKRYMQEHARLFKAVYSPKRPAMSFTSAVEAIKTQLTSSMRDQALALLASGLRISEANAVKDGVVFGKGNKARAVHNAPQVKIEQHKLRRALKPLGLTPHMLRKLAATRAVELGAREADLLAIFGWTSMQTAGYYVQATNSAQVAAKLLTEVL